MKTLGLASLAKTIARQRARFTFLSEGNASTKFFHLQACHRQRKNDIVQLQPQVLTSLMMIRRLVLCSSISTTFLGPLAAARAA
jgi:hypothetical protein